MCSRRICKAIVRLSEAGSWTTSFTFFYIFKQIVLIFIWRHSKLETHPSDEEDAEVEEPEEGRADPDVDHGDEGEDERPEEGAGNGDQRREQPVEPALRLREEHEGQFPHALEAVGVVGLGEDVVEADLQLRGRKSSNELCREPKKIVPDFSWLSIYFAD